MKFPFRTHTCTHHSHTHSQAVRHCQRDSLRRTQIIIVCYSFVSLAHWLSDFRKAQKKKKQQQLKKYSNTTAYYDNNNSSARAEQRSAATTTNNSSNNNNTVELSSVRSLWHSLALTRERRAPTIPFIHGPARSRARQRSSDEEEGKQNYLRFILIHSLWMRGAFYVSGKSRRRASSAMCVYACVCVRE